jgi:hypothetical protein
LTAIDPARLAAALRRATVPAGAAGAPARASAIGGSGTAAGRAASRSAAGAAGAAGAETVAALVARRVQALDRADPDRHRKAFRVFLESVLLAEFGEALVNDAGFHRLVDDVQATMQADREIAGQIRGAAERLLGDPSG